MAQFKIGDVVELKSGGPKMTVDELSNFQGKVSVSCAWFVGTKLERGEFSPDALKLFEQREPPTIRPFSGGEGQGWMR